MMGLVREYVFKFLYHMAPEISQAIRSGQFDRIRAMEKNLLEINTQFCEGLYRERRLVGQHGPKIDQFLGEILANMPSILELISSHLNKGNILRMKSVDLCLLILGCYELKYYKATPPKVVISEVLKLAGQYADSGSPALMNGVLDSVWKHTPAC